MLGVFVKPPSSDNTPYEKIGDEVRSLADEVPFDIPDSWEWVRLGSIVYNRGQITPSTDFCYIDIGSIDNKNQKLNPTDTVIAPDKAPSRARKLVAKGDVLYSTVRPYLHNMCIVDRDFSCIPIASTGFAVLTCHAELCNKFLFYYMMSPDFDAYANNTDNAKGVAYPAINDDRLYKALIPIPPLGEQLRIVSAIESVDMPIRDYGVKEEMLRTLNASFPEALKKSILQEAVQGKLVPQDPSDEPAEALLERIRAEKQRLIKEGKIKKDKHESVIFRRDNSHYEKLDGVERCIDDELPFEIPENCCWCRLETIAAVLGGKRIPAGRKLTECNTGHVYIRVSDMTDGGVSTDRLLYVPEDIYPSISRYIINKADVFITVAGTIGRVGKIPDELDGANLTENADRLVLAGVNQDWLIKVLQSGMIQEQIAAATTQVGQPKLAIARIERFLIPLPPLAEQQRIVQRIEELLPLVKGL